MSRRKTFLKAFIIFRTLVILLNSEYFSVSKKQMISDQTPVLSQGKWKGKVKGMPQVASSIHILKILETKILLYPEALTLLNIM